MAVTIKGKKYKGKYKGPDRFKGDEKKIAAWKAAKRKASTTPAKPATPAAPATPATPAPTQQSAYPAVDPNAVASNASGTIQLQSNYEIDMAEADAHEAIDQEVAAAEQEKALAALDYKQATEALGKSKIEDKGSLNSSLAYRGMVHGTTATDKIAKLESSYNTAKTGIESQLAQVNATADTTVKTAAARRAALDQRFATARQSYTNSQSRNNPTEGSKAEDAGVKPTTIPAAPKPVAAPAAPKPAAKKTYKGKYKGPDRFKGDAKKIAAWKAAKRKAGKK